MRSIFAATLILAAVTPGGARSISLPGKPTTTVPSPDHPGETRERLLEMVHYLFLWHYDQSFFVPGQGVEELQVYFRTVKRTLDPGDNSTFGELWFPATNMFVELKRSDYLIKETDYHVRDRHFKIRRVDRLAGPPAPLDEYRKTVLSRAELHDWFQAHSHRAPPLPQTLRFRLRDTLLENQFQTHWDTESVHIFHIAPLATVSNDVWILHENTNQLLQFSADMDVSDPATWEQLSLRLKFHQLDPRLILTPDRERGGEAELSKDFIGRVLFNCVVLGNRIEIMPAEIQTFLDHKTAPTGSESS